MTRKAGFFGDATSISIAVLAGVFATLAALQSPLLGGMGPLFIPYVPVDARLFALPMLFGLVQAFARLFPWPVRGVALLGLAAAFAVLSHAHRSAVLAFVGAPWALPGTSVGLLGAVASLVSLLLGVFVALGKGQERFVWEAKRRGVGEEELGVLREAGERLQRVSVLTGALAGGVFVLGLSIVGVVLAGARVPLGEVLALGIVLGVGSAYVGLQALGEVGA